MSYKLPTVLAALTSQNFSTSSAGFLYRPSKNEIWVLVNPKWSAKVFQFSFTENKRGNRSMWRMEILKTDTITVYCSTSEMKACDIRIRRIFAIRVHVVGDIPPKCCTSQFAFTQTRVRTGSSFRCKASTDCLDGQRRRVGYHPLWVEQFALSLLSKFHPS